MLNKQILLIIGVVAITVLVFGGIIVWQGQRNNDLAGVVDGQGFRFATAIGQKAPDFTLADQNGTAVNLSQLAGKNVILFFNEGLMCYPACLDQVVKLGQDARLNNENTVSFSVVADSPSSWQSAQKDLPYLKGAKVLFDPGAKVSRMYDTLTLRSSMHKGVYPGHTYYIIGKDGVVRYTLDDPYMGLRNDQLAKEIEKL